MGLPRASLLDRVSGKFGLDEEIHGFPVDVSLTSVKMGVAGLLREEMINDKLKPG